MNHDPEKARKALLAKIHMAKKDLGMDEVTYLEMLKAFGLKSCKEADIPTLERVCAHLKGCGFQEKGRWGKRPRKLVEKDPDCGPLLKKIEALLADGGYHWNYGHGISKKMFGVDRLEWCSWRQLHKIVSALTYNAQRQKEKALGKEST
jgi:phage gp16-like protein